MWEGAIWLIDHGASLGFHHRWLNVTEESPRARGWSLSNHVLGSRATRFTAVKDQALPDFAERFTAAGFATLVFDYRHFGESDGEPRGQLFPREHVEDFRNAITWVSKQSEVDPQRTGIWGTSFGGGVVTFVATFDRRVKAVVAQVPSLLN